jgi:hypothetical protein
MHFGPSPDLHRTTHSGGPAIAKMANRLMKSPKPLGRAVVLFKEIGGLPGFVGIERRIGPPLTPAAPAVIVTP